MVGRRVIRLIDKMKELTYFKEHLTEHILPFWQRALDAEYGGVFTCYTNTGDRLISTDKFTWSQGRFLWLWARIARMSLQGLLAENVPAYTEHARRTYQFIHEHAFLPNGNVSFLLTREGRQKEADTSFYADCFVVLGFTEYARLTGERDVLDKAVQLFRHIEARLAAGTARSEPYPIPEGYEAHGFSMIMLNVSQELADALEEAGDGRAPDIRSRAVHYMEKIMTAFRTERNIILEVIPRNGSADTDTLLARHVNPGHTIECMWFVLTEARKLGRADIMRQALEVTKQAFAIG